MAGLFSCEDIGLASNTVENVGESSRTRIIMTIASWQNSGSRLESDSKALQREISAASMISVEVLFARSSTLFSACRERIVAIVVSCWVAHAESIPPKQTDSN